MKTKTIAGIIAFSLNAFLCQPTSAHDTVLVSIAARLKRVCPQAIIHYDTRAIFQVQLAGVVYPLPDYDEYLIASYHIGVFDTYGKNQYGQLQKQRPHQENGPDNQGFRVIVYTRGKLLHSPIQDYPQNAFPKSFPHLRDDKDGGWIEYINRYRLRKENADIWFDLAYGRESDRGLLKAIKKAVFADAQPIDHHDFPFYN